MEKNCKVGLLLFVLFVICCRGAIVEWKDLELKPNKYFSQRVGMFRAEDAPFAYQNSTFNVDWTITNEDPSQSAEAEVILYHSDFRRGVGIKKGTGREYCCYRDLYDEGKCTDLGRLIRPLEDEDFLKGWFFNFSVGVNQLVLNRQVEIQTQGVWRLLIIRCTADRDTDTGPKLVINGRVRWVNPFGEIPGSIFAFIPFYFVLSFIYFVLGILWIISSARFRKSLLKLQNIIGILILTGFIENILNAGYYQRYNQIGTADLTYGFVTHVAMRIAMRVLAYVVLLILVKGYTIYRPRFRYKEKRNLVIASVLYVIFGLVYHSVKLARNNPPATFSSTIPAVAEYIVAIPTTLMDFLFFVWIFWELFLTVITLHQRKDDARKAMFKVVAKVLMVAYAFTFAFFAFQLIVVIGDFYDFWWRGWWIWDAYYSLGHIVILCIIVSLWRPTANNERYAYNEFEFTNAHQAEIALEPLEVKEIYDQFKVLF